MTDDHIFINSGVEIKVELVRFISVRCKYCGYKTMKNSIGEYLLFNDEECLTGAEKVIKDLLE